MQWHINAERIAARLADDDLNKFQVEYLPDSGELQLLIPGLSQGKWISIQAEGVPGGVDFRYGEIQLQLSEGAARALVRALIAALPDE